MRESSKWKICIIGVIGSALILTGCSPSAQPLLMQGSQPGVLQPNGLQMIQKAVRLGMSENMYKIKSDLTTVQGSLHTDFFVYGSIDTPNLASLNIHENNFNISFYQQGLSAYTFDNGRWSRTKAFPNIDVYPSYSKLLQLEQNQSIPVYEEKDQYVVDEYCKVYRMIIPGKHVTQLSVLNTGTEFPAISNVQYTFFIGETSGQLREIQTSSVGDMSGVGAVQVNSDVILFDIGKKAAKVQIPSNLVKTLEG